MSQLEDDSSLASSECDGSVQFGDSLTVDQQHREMNQQMMDNLEECPMDEMSNQCGSNIDKFSIDVWRDVFDWISPADRKRLSRKFAAFGDRAFSHIFQKWLHEWTKDVCLGKFWIDPRYDNDKSACLRCSGLLEGLPFAEAELPANICDFEGIRISYFDSMVLQFLRQMQPLFRNVMLYVDCDSQESLVAARILFDHLLPLLSGGIQNVNIHSNSSQFLFTIRDHFPAQFFAIRTLIMHIDNIGAFMDLLLAWLSTPLADGQPRMLEVYSGNNLAMEIVHLVGQHFNEAINPVSFLIAFCCYGWEYDGIEECIIENAGTMEQLFVQQCEDYMDLLIGRCSSELDGFTWIEEMVDKKNSEAWKQKTRRITIEQPTLGRAIEIGETAAEEEVNE